MASYISGDCHPVQSELPQSECESPSGTQRQYQKPNLSGDPARLLVTCAISTQFIQKPKAQSMTRVTRMVHGLRTVTRIGVPRPGRCQKGDLRTKFSLFLGQTEHNSPGYCRERGAQYPCPLISYIPGLSWTTGRVGLHAPENAVLKIGEGNPGQGD